MEDEVNKIIHNISEQPEYSQLAQEIMENGLENVSRNFNTSKVDDHFAIIPNGNSPPKSLSGDHKKCMI